MSFLNSKRFSIPFVIGSLGFLTILLSELIVQTQGNKIVEVTWLASVLVTISTLVIRFYSVDSDKFDQIITNTYPVKDQKMIPSRYLNWMVIAMVIGLIATITIHFNFIADGVLHFLFLQHLVTTKFYENFGLLFYQCFFRTQLFIPHAKQAFRGKTSANP